MKTITKTEPPCMLTRLIKVIGSEAFRQHDGWWNAVAFNHPQIIEDALQELAKRRTGAKKVANPGGWLFRTVRDRIGRAG